MSEEFRVFRRELECFQIHLNGLLIVLLVLVTFAKMGVGDVSFLEQVGFFKIINGYVIVAQIDVVHSQIEVHFPIFFIYLLRFQVHLYRSFVLS